jgi:hypothetical protein
METGAFIYLIGQHQTAKRNVLTWFSPKLEAVGGPQFIKCHNDMYQIIHGCKTSQRQTAAALSVKLEEKKGQVKGLRKERKTLAKKNAALEAEVAALRAKYGSHVMP